MEQTEYSETLAYKIQMSQNCPEESIQHSEHGESLKSRILSSSLLFKNVKIKIYRTIIFLPVVLYGCEIWSLTLREECRMMVFENRVLRKIFGPKRDQVTGEWGKLHNEEINDQYSLINMRVIKSRRMRTYGKRGAYRILVGKPEGKKPLVRPRSTWEDNIHMDLQEVGRGAWTGLIWLRTWTGHRLL